MNGLHFIKQKGGFDLGDTPIENIFLNDFMPMANGTYVKVYLLGYKYASDKDPSLVIDHETIVKHLNIPLSDVLNAWNFWEQKGIIKKHYPASEEDKDSEYIVEFLSLKQLFIDNNFHYIKISENNSNPTGGTYSCSPGDLIEANKVPEIKEMFYQVNQLMRRSLVPNEMMEILEWIYNYNMDPDMIVQAFTYCIQQKKIKNIKYIGAVIRNWYDNGIISLEKLEAYLETTDKRYMQYNKIFKSLGFRFREPSQAEKETMDIWFDEWKFNLELILKACENSKKIPNPNINYIHGILSKWQKEGIQSLADLKNKPKKNYSIVKKQLPVQPNRFHNFEQRTAKYSKDELENLLRKNE